MRELTIHDIETIIRSDENRILEVKKTTGEIDAGMSSGCAFLKMRSFTEKPPGNAPTATPPT